MNNIAEQILNDIDTFCQVHFADKKRRTHLGASQIEKKCYREPWYDFRWASQERHSGRMLRLFNRGHLEEPRVYEYLRGIGCEVYDLDENGKQFKFSAIDGHFGGSCDGKLKLPPRYGFGDELFLIEIKTSNDSNFKKMKKHGVQKSKPQHWGQMNLYGYMMGLLWAIYIVINKNDDELYIEIVTLDPNKGRMLENVARGIIQAQTNPLRISDKETHYVCKMCNYSDHCHFNKPWDKNCRSCAHSEPIFDGQWGCNLAQSIIPEEVILEGCECWEQLSNV